MKFGSGTRDQANRLFISADHEKCQVGGWAATGSEHARAGQSPC